MAEHFTFPQPTNMLRLFPDSAGLHAVGIRVPAQQCGKRNALTSWTQGCCAWLQGCTLMGMRSHPFEIDELHTVSTHDPKKA